MELPPAVNRMVRTVPGEARTVIGLVSAFGLVMMAVVGALLWWDATHDDAGPPEPAGLAQPAEK